MGVIFRALLRWILSRLRPGATAVLDMQDVVVQQFTADRKATEPLTKTIFDAPKDPSIPPGERSPRRLEDEGMIMVLAGTETIARALAVAAFHLYQDRPLLLKVREELQQAMPTPISEPLWSQLEQLP